MGLFAGKVRGEDVRPGDIFRKAGTYGGEWRVEAVFDYPDIPRHARLVQISGARVLTVAVSLLFDPNAFTLVSSGEDGTFRG